MLQEKVMDILAKEFKRDRSLFLLDLSVTADHRIRVVLDGDKGVSLQDCMKISRGIENELDREEFDYSLEVTSAGATAPLQMERQYVKNIGRKLAVKSMAGSLEGKLTAVNDGIITLEWKAREPKPVGKGKVTVQKKQQIAISEIEEAKVVLKF